MNVIHPQQLHQQAAIRQREVADGVAAERQRRAARPARDRLILVRAVGRQLWNLRRQGTPAHRPASLPTGALAGDAPT